ncbi:MAG: alpha/beta fold hydrolase BchO [Pseudomonadota bacterium]
MDRARDLADWPLADHARSVRMRPHDWHVVEMGQGNTILMLHGAGGSTHSWAGLMPLLAADYHIVALDLPGQGFTRAGTKRRLSLDHMAQDVLSLLQDQGWRPDLIIGHSAGGALGLHLASLLDHPSRVVGINAALEPFEGIAGWLFPTMAKMLALNPFTAMALTMGGQALPRVRSLIGTTGSEVPDESLQCYTKLFSDYAHVDSTLQMMAQWDVDLLTARLFAQTTPTLLIAGAGDMAVPPAVSKRAAQTMPNAHYIELDRLGHLAHEEAPERIVSAIMNWVPGEAVRQD